jgi:hypothetical protein
MFVNWYKYSRFEKVESFDETLIYLRKALDIEPSSEIIAAKIAEIKKTVCLLYFDLILENKLSKFSSKL